MTVRPLALPRLSRSAAAAARLRAAPRAPLRLLGGPLQLCLADDTAPAPWGTGHVCVSVRWGQDRLEVRCPESLPERILKTLGPDLDVAAVPPDLGGLLLDAGLLTALMAFERASGREVAILAMERDRSLTPPVGLALRLTDGDMHWPLLLSEAKPDGHTPSPIACILDLWPVAPAAMSRFPWPAVLRLGATRLPMEVVASLRPGDAVRLQTSIRSASMSRTSIGGDAMLVVAEAWTAPARQEPTGWTLSAAPRPAHHLGTREWTMTDNGSAGGDETDGRSLGDPDEVTVRLSFEVGRLDVTFGDLRRLGPGSVLELGRGIAELVRISANGRIIGHGELVEVEGAAAVRIVRFFDHG